MPRLIFYLNIRPSVCTKCILLPISNSFECINRQFMVNICPACSAAEASLMLEIPFKETLEVLPAGQQKKNALISLRGYS